MAKILVMDDEKIIRIIIQRFLEKAGHEVTLAEDGKIGMDYLCSNYYDLVITDIIMPNQEGLETIRQLRKDFPDLKIIAMSGGGKVGPIDYLSLAERFGAHATYLKSSDWDSLVELTEKILSGEND